eukprot:CAMPEP_0194073256 /NCGR_PEP_ID=MMETSP0149-20130528/750_1 /TAXON_ID=122233 /ORGANISM="Chaetoceros debilis, Strain MM31A-1" /LENGTH=306 /DNA_ID=CAMNT_0038753249 /DNA_START=302 /DNA_END=1222 /DNA_ORIENTATION=+
MSSSSNFLSVSECIQRHSLENTIFVDGSWHLSSRDGREEYENGPRIQNSRFFDIDDVATKNHPHNVPHMMPPKKLFALAMDNLEISPSSDIIIYGTAGSFSTPRTYYTLRAMGHDTSRLHMMEGSLKEWIDAGGPIETGKKESVKMEDMDLSINTDDIKYDAAVDAKNVVDYEEVTDIVNKGEDSDSIIVDARSAGRFVGEAPEPRPGLKGGHMPGAKNVPFNILMEEGKMNKFLSKEEMVKIFKEAGVDVETDKKIVCTCGSGVTACVLTAALEECGRDPATTMIYDGSWIEWASTEDAPVIKRE